MAIEYNKMWHFSDCYKEWMLNNISDFLKFNLNDIFVDIGGGTAEYTKLIMDKVKLNNKAYCVEPSAGMSKIAENNSNINIFNEYSDEFFKRPIKYDKVLLKEMLHYIEDRPSFWNNLYNNMNEDGCVLIVTRPQNVKMPFFDAAKASFHKIQPPYEDFIYELKQASFDVDIKIKQYSFDMKTETWLYLVHQRFMSSLKDFSDKEIENGISEIIQKYVKDTSGTIVIDDEIIYISAVKKCATQL
jgi:trans-aconitate methyltransferase